MGRSTQPNDRMSKYAERDSVVKGTVLEDGEWLRVEGDVYLPMKLKLDGHDQPIAILELCTDKAPSGTQHDDSSGRGCFWCAARTDGAMCPRDEVFLEHSHALPGFSGRPSLFVHH